MIPGITAGGAFADEPVYYWQRVDASGAEAEVIVGEYTECVAYVIGGAGGGGRYLAGQGASGAGGYSVGYFAVTSGETLRIRVGIGGQGAFKGVSSYGGLGGWPGGGSGAFGDAYCGGGGGYSGVFRDDGTPLVIAGAGGGGSGYATAAGAGGGVNGQVGSVGANGGTQTAGGTATYSGSAYQGGNANGGDRTTTTTADSGGGGGGYYGGGAPSSDGGTGGGGSGYIGSGVTGQTYSGNKNARPAEIPAAINGDSTADYGVGVVGVSATDGAADNGGDGVIWLRFSA